MLYGTSKKYVSAIHGIEDNILIHSENLVALRMLEDDYFEEVRCIYIDPPYNTGKKWNHYDDKAISSDWLVMMRERIEIMHRLLRIDGTMWISIDDRECHYLKVMCDEIFGRNNFVCNVIWEKKFSIQNDAKWMSQSHDHILVYAKCKDIKKWNNGNKKGLNLFPRTEEMDARYKNPDNDERGLWMADSLSVKTYSSIYDYPITTPSGRVVHPPAGRCWRFSKEKLSLLIADNRILFGPNGNNVPTFKRFLSEVQTGRVSSSIWWRKEVGDNRESKLETKAINSDVVFDTPKPERLLERIIYLATDPGDIVLDCFAGSGTTGAVAHKMGRRWIMIEMGDHMFTHIIPRLQMVIDGTDSGGVTASAGWRGGGGFNFYEIER